MSRSTILFFIIVLLTAAGGYYVWKDMNALPHGQASAEEKGKAASSPAPAAAAARAMPVGVITLKKQDINATMTLPGRVAALRQAQIRPQVDGIIKERLFEEGALVKKDDQLYQIDDTRYAADLNAAKADLKAAKSQINSISAKAARYRKLVKIDAVSRQEYDDVIAELDKAKADIAVAEAAVDVAQVNLDYTKVYAPITGRIGRSLFTEGALVTANQSAPLAIITQLDPIYVDMQLASGKAAALQSKRSEMDTPITVDLQLGENNEITYPHQGQLKFAEVTIEQTTGSMTLRAEMPNPDETLLPGLFVRAALNLGTEKRLTVPQRATTRTPNGNLTVWVVDGDNKAAPRIIQTERAYNDQWVIASGLMEGEKIVVEGYQKLSDGMAVSPQPYEATAPQQ